MRSRRRCRHRHFHRRPCAAAWRRTRRAQRARGHSPARALEQPPAPWLFAESRARRPCHHHHHRRHAPRGRRPHAARQRKAAATAWAGRRRARRWRRCAARASARTRTRAAKRRRCPGARRSRACRRAHNPPCPRDRAAPRPSQRAAACARRSRPRSRRPCRPRRDHPSRRRVRAATVSKNGACRAPRGHGRARGRVGGKAPHLARLAQPGDAPARARARTHAPARPARSAAHSHRMPASPRPDPSTCERAMRTQSDEH